VLLGGLAVSLYSAGGGSGNVLAQTMGAVFLGVAVFAGAWSYWVVVKRREMIMQRSGKDFDFLAGPLVVSVALAVALVVNFGFAVGFFLHFPTPHMLRLLPLPGVLSYRWCLD
jgi:hypothetical protein